VMLLILMTFQIPFPAITISNVSTKIGLFLDLSLYAMSRGNDAASLKTYLKRNGLYKQ